jgi:hypothetical protein
MSIATVVKFISMKYSAALAVSKILAERDDLFIGSERVVQRPVQSSDHAHWLQLGAHADCSA